MKIRIVRLSELDSQLRLTAERYVLTDEECRAELRARVEGRLRPLLAEKSAIEAAGHEELRDRYAIRFFRRR